MRELDDRMGFGHVIRVLPDGTANDDVPEGIRVHAPESIDVDSDDDGQISAEDDAAMVAQVARDGWQVLNGWSAQSGYAGPIMHSSEYIGGALAVHILETPGFWVAVTVENIDDPEHPAGWALLYRPSRCTTCNGELEPSEYGGQTHVNDDDDTHQPTER